MTTRDPKAIYKDLTRYCPDYKKTTVDRQALI